MIPNKELRRRLVEKGHEIRSGHFGSSLSCLDSIKYLYDYVLKKDDIFILSKGHGDMALYAVLESKGYNVPWTPHLNLNEKEGIYATTGSLGHGLPIGLGRAFGKKINGEDGTVYVMTGDGEMQEGSNWEALTLANALNIDNLVLLVDWNKYQATGDVSSVGGLDAFSLYRRLDSFGFNTQIINGHDDKDLSKLKKLEKGLNAIILNTVKGKGVECLEKNHAHGYSWTEEDRLKSLEDLK
jgi:transketolase